MTPTLKINCPDQVFKTSSDSISSHKPGTRHLFPLTAGQKKKSMMGLKVWLPLMRLAQMLHWRLFCQNWVVTLSHCVETNFDSEGFFSDRNCKFKPEADSSWRSRSCIKLGAEVPKLFTFCTTVNVWIKVKSCPKKTAQIPEASVKQRLVQSVCWKVKHDVCLLHLQVWPPPVQSLSTDSA